MVASVVEAAGEWALCELTDEIRVRIEDERAPGLLHKYYSGRYTGALFDTAAQLRSPDPNRFTAHDIAAVSTLSVPMSGWAVAGLEEREEQLAALLGDVPSDVDLAEASDDDLEAVLLFNGRSTP